MLRPGEPLLAHLTWFGLYPKAKLAQGQIDELVAGLRATPGLSEGR